MDSHGRWPAGKGRSGKQAARDLTERRDGGTVSFVRRWVIALVLLVSLPVSGAIHVGYTACALTNSAVSPKPATPPPTRKMWGNMATLQDHFERHGRDFRAKDPEDYARMAWEFLQRA